MASGSFVERQCEYACHASMNEALRFSVLSSWRAVIAHPAKRMVAALIVHRRTGNLAVMMKRVPRRKLRRAT